MKNGWKELWKELVRELPEEKKKADEPEKVLFYLWDDEKQQGRKVEAKDVTFDFETGKFKLKEEAGHDEI